MNILAIGNSFSEDATRYLHNIAKADGENLQVTNLYIGGCSLERHYRNMLSDEKKYELQYNGHRTGFYVSLREALLNRKWDVITLQQVSSSSFVKESYLPYIISIADFVRRYAPQVKLYLHQTWAYEEGSQKLFERAKYDRADRMLNDIVKVNLEIADLIGAEEIIRSGELFGELLKKGIKEIYRDTYHASLGIGRYALALLWYRTITKKPVLENRFCDFDEPISEEEIRLIKETVDCLD
ncbi:MAG: DUF4886 domain-containing protein [Ruminococcaceae bacterium]|nr:DUF4886 domain-containing protein [Oscillospiraceae bacterium]